MRPDNIIIIADIEGSSGCWSYEASQFMTREWAHACVDMSKDINAVVAALFDSGIKNIIIKDFHRTGYNLIPELIDQRAAIVHGYKEGPVPGIGNPGNAEALFMIGMHAASGSSGFLAHTLTSRIEKLTVNGRLLSEGELFSASLSQFGISPHFFSGCPVACRHAKKSIPDIVTFKIDKNGGPDFLNKTQWRENLAKKAINSLEMSKRAPFTPQGPFTAHISMRDGNDEAKKIARRWNFHHHENTIIIESNDIHQLYLNLIRISYLTPMIEKLIPYGLPLYNLMGKFGLEWAKRKSSNN